MSSRDNRGITDYLKGVAILTVYVNHFINDYITQSLKGYANGFISIFFLLSGFGIYISLTRLYTQKNSNFMMLFFRKRLLRIYPLFWIWFISNSFFHGFPNNFLFYFALDFINTKSPWFIPALIQCYLLAPFLFLFFRNTNTKKSLLLLVGSFIIINAISFSLGWEPIISIGYRNLFFHHIFLFCLGFILATLETKRELPVYLILLSLFLYLFFIQETTAQAFIVFPGKDIVFPFLFSFSTFFICFAFLSGNIHLPFRSLLQIIGQYSYSIYLFHNQIFNFLEKIGFLEKYNVSLITIIFVLLASPIFIFSCSVLEMAINEFVFGKRDIKNVIKKIKEFILIIKTSFQRNAAPDRYSSGKP